MLICFGISWPVDIFKSIRSKRTEGKSLAFMVIIALGYCLGILGKFQRVGGTEQLPEAVTVLYALNVVLVAADITLFLHYRRRGRLAEVKGK